MSRLFLGNILHAISRRDDVMTPQGEGYHKTEHVYIHTYIYIFSVRHVC